MDKFYDEVKFFWNKRSKKEKFLWKDELFEYKLSFIKKNIKNNSDILDLGAGDCKIAVKISDISNTVTAVEYSDILDSVKNNKILTIKDDAFNFLKNNNKKFDYILIIGVMNFIEDPYNFYKMCKISLKNNGSLIVAHQCGKYDDVFISNMIDGDEYRSIYRGWEKEVKILESQGFIVNTLDPYPSKFNVHNNTIFKGFICKI